MATAAGRWPLLRTGTRNPIPDLTRRLVLGRDAYRCTLCGDHGQLVQLVLDHIVPWSALGSDLSDNLRALCWPCNEARSNFREPYLPRVLPVTPVCSPCLNAHDDVTGRRHFRTTAWRYCPACCGGEAYDRSYRPEPADERAWCGTCTAASWCDDWQRVL